MANILILVSNIEFDPAEACVPWKVLTDAGHNVWFASEDGGAPICDVITLTGEGLPKHLQSLAARPANREIYEAMAKDKRFINSLAWRDIAPDDFDALVLPGGHAPGVKPYLESEDVFRICRNFFDRKAPVSSVCHGVLALSRAKREDGYSLLHGYKVTGLTNLLEKNRHQNDPEIYGRSLSNLSRNGTRRSLPSAEKQSRFQIRPRITSIRHGQKSK